jgi:hypothetical protein
MGTFGTAAKDVRRIQQDATEAAAADGFAVLRRHCLRTVVSDDEFDAFGEFWNDLPLDEQLPGGAKFRYRRYGRLRVEVGPQGPDFEILPHVTFRQDSIPLWRGAERRFSPIDEKLLLHPGMAALVGFDTELATQVSGQHSWEVGIHLIRMVARPGEHGLPTPEGRHRDGHLYVGMHLIRREDCEGGQSTVYPEYGDPVSLTLRDPLDSLFVDDRRVTHEVSPIRAVRADGIRDMLLVDVNAYGAAG